MPSFTGILKMLAALTANIFGVGFVGVVKETVVTVTRVLLSNIGSLFGSLFGIKVGYS